jgi:hypothetical protein
VNRPKRGCCEHPCSSVGLARAVMPHGGLGERFVCEPVPRGPEALFTFGRGTCRRLSASPGRRAYFFIAEARSTERPGGRPCCLSSQSKARARTTQSRTRPARVHPLPGGAETGAITSFRPRKSLVASHQRETRTERLWDVRPKPTTRRRSLPLPRLVLSPRTGRDLEKRCALCAEPPPLRSEALATACCKDNGHSLSLSGWSAPAETRATQQPKSWRPEPSRPYTGETRDDCSSREHLCFPENPPPERTRAVSRTLAPRLSREGRSVRCDDSPFRGCIRPEGES